MSIKTLHGIVIKGLCFLAILMPVCAQSTTANALQHPRDQIALQLGAIQMGYDLPFVLSGSISPEKMQQAVNALVMGRNSLNATITAPAVQVQGAVDCPNVNTVEYRDQLYMAVEYVVTSPVVATIKGSANLANSKKVNVSATKLSIPSQVWTIPVPYALEARTSVESVDVGDSTPTSTSSTQLAALSQNVTALSTQVASLVSNLGNSTQSVESLSQNLTALQTQVSSLSGNSSSSNITALAADFNHLKNSLVGTNVVRDYEKTIVSTISSNSSEIFRGPSVMDPDGNIYMTNFSSTSIIKVTPSGGVTTLASLEDTFQYSGLSLDSAGNIYYTRRYKIQKVTPAGVVTTLAGSGSSGSADGTGAAASFGELGDLVLDSAGNIYVVESDNYRNSKIRKVTPAGVVTTLAGSGLSGSADGTGSAASFGELGGLVLDSAGNVYVAEFGASVCKIRKVSPTGVVTTFANVSGGLHGMVIDGNGNLFVAVSSLRFEEQYSKIIKITSNGVVSDFCGIDKEYSGGRDGKGLSARLAGNGLRIDQFGNLYFKTKVRYNSSDYVFIRKITPSGIVTTLAGSFQESGNGYGYEAGLHQSTQIIGVDKVGNVYFKNSLGSPYLIRRISTISP